MIEEDYCILIPARKASKGLPFKNRTLFEHTAKIIPKEMKNKVFVSTDDEYIIEKAKEFGFKVHFRSAESASDSATTKDMLEDFISGIGTDNPEKVIMLYLTYPNRTWNDVKKAVDFFEKNEAKTMLCREEISDSPYLMMFESGIKGRQVIDHNLSRRQDYKKCFKISHYIYIFLTKEVSYVNNNGYNEDTIFFKIKRELDVDTEEDLGKLK